MAKLLNSQSKAWETILYQHAMHKPITGLGNGVIPEFHAVNTPYKRVWRSSEMRQEEGRDFSGSLAQAIGKPLDISAQSG